MWLSCSSAGPPQYNVVHQDKDAPPLGSGVFLLLQEAVHQFGVPLREEEPRVPVLHHQLVEHGVRSGAPDKGDHEVKLAFHHRHKVAACGRLALAAAPYQAEVERDLGNEPGGIPLW